MNSLNPFIARLGIAFPIIQAPMASVSTPQLAAAVSNAGGLGSLGIGASTADQARKMIEETRSLTREPFNVNVFCHAPAERDAAREAAWLRYLAPLFAEAQRLGTRGWVRNRRDGSVEALAQGPASARASVSAIWVIRCRMPAYSRKSPRSQCIASA